MKKFDEWFFPDDEKHLLEWMKEKNQVIDGRLTYQYHKYEEALKYVRNHRVALDVGAHIGLWSFFMARDFGHVVAFEPMQEHRDCWIQNLDGVKNFELFSNALGHESGEVSMVTDSFSTGNTRVGTGGNVVKVNRLDDFAFPVVDFMKIDCEGYEMNVLRGACDTIKRCKPCIIVEQKGNMAERYGNEKMAAVDYIKSLGAEMRAEISGDFILSWD